MRGVNKVILLGTVFRDPEMRSLAQSGSTVTSIILSTSDSWKDKNTGNTTWSNEYHRVVFYGRLAEITGEYLRKDSKVYVEGSIHTRKWQDKTTGQDRYSTEIKANTIEFLDGRGGDGSNQSSGVYENDYGGGANNNSYGQDDYQAPRTNRAPTRPAAPVSNDLDDDLPF